MIKSIYRAEVWQHIPECKLSLELEALYLYKIKK
jgi:hypothetical protein